MKIGVSKWVLALCLSFLAHTGLAGLFPNPSDKVLVEGGIATEAATLGFAFNDSIASDSAETILDPVETELEKLESVNEQLAEEVVEATEPLVSSTTPTTPQTQLKPLKSGPNPKTVNARAELVKSQIESTRNTEQFKPVESISVLPAPTALHPEQETIKPIETAALDPQIAENTELLELDIPALEIVPVPTPKDSQRSKRAKKEKKEPVIKRKEKPAKKAKAEMKESGKEQRTAKRGAATGKKSAKGQSEGKKKRTAKVAGNAAFSNYKGKVRRKLVRAFRPSNAVKRKARKAPDVWVQFTILSSGKVSGVRISSSSGLPGMDKAAVSAVHRAAPFPKIPSGAGRSTWPFNVPLAVN